MGGVDIHVCACVPCVSYVKFCFLRLLAALFFFFFFFSCISWAFFCLLAGWNPSLLSLLSPLVAVK